MSENQQAEGIRPFADFLRDQRRGDFQQECSKALHELITSVSTLGKGGSLTIKIDVKPINGKVTGLAVAVSDTIEVKPPKVDAPAQVFFVTPGHNLSKNDPLQQNLSLRSVDAEQPKALKEAN